MRGTVMASIDDEGDSICSKIDSAKWILPINCIGKTDTLTCYRLRTALAL
jgi:hypothetical protein